MNCGLRLRGDLGERRRLRGGHVGQHLAVEGDAGGFQPAHELRVRQPVVARRRVDPDDPQPPELPLLVLASDVRVLLRRVDRFLGRPIELALRLVKTLRSSKQLLPLGPAYCSSFYSWHRPLTYRATSDAVWPRPDRR